MSKPQINVRRVKVLRLSQAMPKWKKLRVPVHPDGTVCTAPNECNMPHTITVGTYKLKKVTYEK